MIVNLVDNKFYIGSSKSLIKRKNNILIINIMYAENEKKVLKEFLQNQIEKNRRIMLRDIQKMNNKEFDRMVNWINQDAKMLKEIEEGANA